MPAPQFSVRSEYRAPNRRAFNMCGTEGCRSPGNIPRSFGMLNSELRTFGGTESVPSPDKQRVVDDDDRPADERFIIAAAEVCSRTARALPQLGPPATCPPEATNSLPCDS